MDHCLDLGAAARRLRPAGAPLVASGPLALLLAGCTYAPERTIPDPLPEVRAWVLAERPAGAYLGLTLVENDSGTLEELAFAPGLRVVEVVSNSPAAQAGFQVDDVLLTADGKELFAPADVDALLGVSASGASLSFEVQRGDTVFEVPVALAVTAGDAALVQPQFHLDPVRSRAAWGDAPSGGPRGAVLVSRPEGEGPMRRMPVGTVVTAVDDTAVLSGRGLVRELALRAPKEELTFHGTTPNGEESQFDVQLLGEGRVVTRASVPVLFTYDADLEADRRNFVLLDLWVISLIRYERDGNERRWRFLRFFEWSSGVGELGD
jgi:hypothetical protein